MSLVDGNLVSHERTTMYKVKSYNRSNAEMMSESNPMEYTLAMELARVVGSGEGYWVEVVEVFDGYTITRYSTV